MTITVPFNFNPATRPYQLEVLKNPARFKSMIIHRKAGKTALAINKLNIEAHLNPNKVFWYVAPTYTQAKEIVWRDPDMLFKYIPKELIAKTNETELVVYLKNGSIIALKGADKPDSLRGPNPFGTILDEFPLLNESIWNEILAPIVFANPNAWVWFIGTPKPTGAFWHQFHDSRKGKKDWFTMDLTADKSGILTQEMLADARDNMTEEAYEQEYLCKWMDEEGVVFRGIKRCLMPFDYQEKFDPRVSYQFGTDLAMHVDWTVMLGINKARREVEYFDRYNQIDYNLQKARIEANMRRYANPLNNMDATGVGEPVVQDLQSRGLNVNGVKFSAQTKKNLITNLALMIEQGRIKFPNIPELVEELQVYGYEVTKSGNIVYSAPQGKHDDCVMALALACWELGSQVSGAVKAGVREKRLPVQFY